MSEWSSVRYQFINNTKTCSFIQTLTFSPKSISKVVFLSLKQICHTLNGIEIEIEINLLTKSGPQEGIYK